MDELKKAWEQYWAERSNPAWAQGLLLERLHRRAEGHPSAAWRDAVGLRQRRARDSREPVWDCASQG